MTLQPPDGMQIRRVINPKGLTHFNFCFCVVLLYSILSKCLLPSSLVLESLCMILLPSVHYTHTNKSINPGSFSLRDLIVVVFITNVENSKVEILFVYFSSWEK